MQEITVDGQAIGDALMLGDGKRALDLKTGNVVRWEDCPQEDRGEARPAVKAGKRFIQIPNLDEASTNAKAKYENRDRNADFEPIGADGEDYKEFCDSLNEDMASQEIAMRWIRSLQPQCAVIWTDSGLYSGYTYDPTRADWIDGA